MWIKGIDTDSPDKCYYIFTTAPDFLVVGL